ncbi:MAG TPA: type II secretion system protein [Desulfitobacteriaceae bacterium]|nr:type II secretion system protein [Desulfitobacteriaceae bacterium]
MSRIFHHNRKNHGFTLVELIVVIGILAILAVLAIPAVAGHLENSKAQTNLANAKIIYDAGHAYLATNLDKTKTDVTLENLTADKYLASTPKTALGRSYVIDKSGTDLLITWSKETNIAPESGGKYPY